MSSMRQALAWVLGRERGTSTLCGPLGGHNGQTGKLQHQGIRALTGIVLM